MEFHHLGFFHFLEKTSKEIEVIADSSCSCVRNDSSNGLAWPIINPAR